MLAPDGMVVLVLRLLLTVPCIFFPFNAQFFTPLPLLPKILLLPPGPSRFKPSGIDVD